MTAAPTHSKAPLPTPFVTTCPTPGTYTVSAETITVNKTKSVFATTWTTLTPGTNSYGGYSTSVNCSTTLTIPYCTTTTESTVTKTLTSLTTVTCETPGEYTPVAPTTTVVSVSTVVVYPVPMTFTPSVYTRPETTITATVTEEVFVCPYSYPYSTTTSTSTNLVTVTATETSSASPIATSTWSSSPAPAPPASSSPAPAPPASSSPAAPQSYPQSSSAPAPSGGSSSGISTNGNKWAITYTPYTTTGQCKTADEVNSDIATIAGKGFKAVRLYATDCSGLQNVGSACQANGLKIIIGVFIESSGISGAQSQVQQIIEWGQAGNWGLVELCVIGNEAIFNGYCSAEDLAQFISSSKQAFQSAGYSGPCTTTEPLNILQENSGTLCAVIDVVASNIEPFFNSDVTADQAGSFVASQLQLTGQCCPGLTAYNLECGWPSNGSNNGAAVPGSSEQATAINGILESCGQNTVFFSYDNDEWKDPGTFNVEQYFGCMDLF